ncbi:hypothetical protein GDO81_003895 [Engystomops pustulosus]|uniref:Uncharacterized protein n=1 Tax=Engystomops pustulosus TaxID=76066 RepID=A0AAV6ZZQ7_ENGPU|nr:hypothetical protein GDO81_003895 [Engystomops pustulosus]
MVYVLEIEVEVFDNLLAPWKPSLFSWVPQQFFSLHLWYGNPSAHCFTIDQAREMPSALAAIRFKTCFSNMRL